MATAAAQAAQAKKKQEPIEAIKQRLITYAEGQPEAIADILGSPARRVTTADVSKGLSRFGLEVQTLQEWGLDYMAAFKLLR